MAEERNYPDNPALMRQSIRERHTVAQVHLNFAMNELRTDRQLEALTNKYTGTIRIHNFCKWRFCKWRLHLGPIRPYRT
jgi:hypothetical protein